MLPTFRQYLINTVTPRWPRLWLPGRYRLFSFWFYKSAAAAHLTLFTVRQVPSAYLSTLMFTPLVFALMLRPDKS